MSSAATVISNLLLSFITYLFDKEGGKPAKASEGDGAGFPFILLFLFASYFYYNFLHKSMPL